MSPRDIQPRLVFADSQSQIYDHPELLMLLRRGRQFTLPKPDELIELPAGSDMFLLPQRQAVGFNPQTAEIESLDEQPVAAFVCPGFTLSGHTAYLAQAEAESLPLFAYGPVGYAQGSFWTCAQRVDPDPRQRFESVSTKDIARGVQRLLKRYPNNRLLGHLARCALSYFCPAAKNLALGRFEAPLPTAQTCNARCLGCISRQEPGSGFPANQERINFRPTVKEITQIMFEHARREPRPIFSFGQGCEGEPLTEAQLIEAAIHSYRESGGKGTININTNASLPQTIPRLTKAGLDSIRVSLNSARESSYNRYHRPQGYTLNDVRESIKLAKQAGIFVSLNLLFFPGLNDQEQEFSALVEWSSDLQIDYIQLRNLNIDPEFYLKIFSDLDSPVMGLNNFLKRLGQACPKTGIGYFNPCL